MSIVAWFAWIMMWGAAGYFTVGAILNRIQYRRTVKQINAIRELCSEVDRALGKES